MTERAHETSFVGGVVQCSCGWRSRRLCWSFAEVEDEAQRHLARVVEP